jgi:hypothetical protein
MSRLSRLSWRPLRRAVVLAVAVLDLLFLAPGARALAPPATPGPFFLGGMAVTDSEMYLGFQWYDNNNDESGFRLEEKQGIDGTYWVVFTLGASSTNVGGIAVPRDGNSYLFRLVAFNAAGESSPSNEVEIDTDLGAQVPPPLPNTPAGFQIVGEAVTATQISLGFQWVDESSDETGFRIEERQGAGGTYFVVATTQANVTSLGGITIPRDGRTYYFRVKSFNANGESDPSNEVSIVATP